MYTAGREIVHMTIIPSSISFSSSDTVSRSGVYCSLSIALEQCKTESVIDVFQVTKAVKRSKPGAVTTLVIIE